MEHLRPRKYMPSGPQKAHRRSGRAWGRVATVIGATALFSVVLPFGIGGAAPSQPMPSLKDLVAQARTLSNEINSLNEQYNGLKIQLHQAQTEARVAEDTYVRDLTELRAGNLAVGQLAAQSYMHGGLTTPLELLTTSSASTLIGRAAFVQELQKENGDQVSQIAEGVAAAQRARASAAQQTRRAKQLTAQMASKRRDFPPGVAAAAGSLTAAKAGHMASSSGSESAIPAPRRKRRRVRDDVREWGLCGISHLLGMQG